MYGPRNPHRTESLLRPETPLGPTDLYGAHKMEAEALVRESGLEWVILRLGGVLTSELKLDIDKDTLCFEAALPADGRIHTVDVRDVAAAFATAVSTPSAREVFLIGGDASHRLRQSDIGSSVAAAAGLVNALPPGKLGDPQSGENWFATDWMDTSRSEQALDFQHHSFPSMVDEIRTRARLSRYLAVAVSPLLRMYLQRLSPYRGDSTPFADPWRVIADRLGNPEPDRA